MRSIVLLATATFVACAPGRLASPRAQDISSLRSAVQRDSADVGARIGLAIALRDGGQTGEALSILERVVVERPGDPGPQLLLGLTSEDAGNWTRASAAYDRYLTLAVSEQMRRSIERRQRYVRRMELQTAARTSLAREAELTSTAPDPRAVGVFPFLFQSADTTLRPLSRALAFLLVTDLSQTDRLTVLERAEIQFLLDEMRLGERGPVDPATAARAGRLMRVGKVIQGTIDGAEAQLRLEAMVVGVGRDTVEASPPLAEQDPLDRLIDMEKRLALGIYGSLGVVLTPAEEQRVLRRPTANVLALLEFGRGLEAEDRGDYEEAARRYDSATALDPGFGPAAERGEEVGAIGEAEATPVSDLVAVAVQAEAIPVSGAGSGTGLAPPNVGGGSGPAGGILSPDPLGGGLPDPIGRDPGAEVLGGEGIGIRSLLRIIFRRPAG